MILLIGRDGILASASLAAVRKHSSDVGIFATSCRRYSRTPTSCTTTRLLCQPGSNTTISSWVRQMSSIPSSVAEKVKPAPSEPPPPIRGQPGKKTKVELRPAPVKPKPEEVFPKSHTTTEHSHKAHHPSAAAPSETLHSVSSHTHMDAHPHREGVIESARHDFETASSHGILAPPPPGASKLQTIIHQAKEYFKFYWNGLKLINTNRIRSGRMRARVAAGGPALTRWETRFVKTYKEDAIKLIPFALIIIIAEEAIPLVVMWAPFLLPSTCVLPSQKERIAAKKREKQQAVAQVHKSVFQEVLKRGESEKGMHSILGTAGAKAVGGLLGQPSWTLGMSFLPFRRVERHLANIAADDTLLLQEGLGERLTDGELREALEERGILTDGLTPKQWQSRLRWWLRNVSIDHANSNTDAIVRRVLLVAQSGIGQF